MKEKENEVEYSSIYLICLEEIKDRYLISRS